MKELWPIAELARALTVALGIVALYALGLTAGALLADVAIDARQPSDAWRFCLMALYASSFPCGILFLIWWTRARRNLPALHAPQKSGARRALLYWFLPVANWVLPFLESRALWRGSDPGRLGVEPSPDRIIEPSSLASVTVWWFLVLSALVLQAISVQVGVLGYGPVTSASWLLDAATTLVTAFAVGATALFVHRVTRMQTLRASALGDDGTRFETLAVERGRLAFLSLLTYPALWLAALGAVASAAAGLNGATFMLSLGCAIASLGGTIAGFLSLWKRRPKPAPGILGTALHICALPLAPMLVIGSVVAMV